MNLRDLPQDEWKAYCKDCELSSIYLDPRWLELIESVYPGLKIHRLACRDTRNGISWLLPLVEIKPLGKTRPMMISLPFGNYGGFILPNDNNRGLTDDDLNPLFHFFRKSRASVLEFREMDEPAHGLHVEKDFRTFEVFFPEEIQLLWKKIITGNARTSVRKADKFHLEAVFDCQEAVKIFQGIYERNASFHGTPIHRVKWYETLMTLFHQEGEIVLARYKQEFIGALLILHYHGRAILHAAVTDPQYRKIPITDKLVWSAFERIIEKKKAKSFDFGRTRSDPGKIFFKRKWGGVERPLYYAYLVKPGHKIPQIVPENPTYKPAIAVWRHLPMALKRAIGPFFRSRIPT